jgi:hypothetical protein
MPATLPSVEIKRTGDRHSLCLLISSDLKMLLQMQQVVYQRLLLFFNTPSRWSLGLPIPILNFFRVPGMDEDMNEYVGLGERLSNQRKAMVSAEIHDILCSLTRVESYQAGLPQGIRAILKP